MESRQAMMPQVRIRNVSKEYKLVASVFSPELLKLEESWGKSESHRFDSEFHSFRQDEEPQKRTATKSSLSHIKHSKWLKTQTNLRSGSEQQV